jgi:hypothetical protein
MNTFTIVFEKTKEISHSQCLLCHLTPYMLTKKKIHQCLYHSQQGGMDIGQLNKVSEMKHLHNKGTEYCRHTSSLSFAPSKSSVKSHQSIIDSGASLIRRQKSACIRTLSFHEGAMLPPSHIPPNDTFIPPTSNVPHKKIKKQTSGLTSELRSSTIGLGSQRSFMKNSLLWCLFEKGYTLSTKSSPRHLTRANYEMEEKRHIVEYLKTNVSCLKPYKITKQQVQEIMSDLLTNQPIHMIHVYAFAVYYRQHIVLHFVETHSYVEIRNVQESEQEMTILVSTTHQPSPSQTQTTWNIYHGSTQEYYERLQHTCIPQYSWKQTLRPCSTYKLHELIHLANKIQLPSFSQQPKWKKNDLYQELTTYFATTI